MPTRRTFLVIFSLAASLTGTSGLLMALEPGAVVESHRIRLAATRGAREPTRTLFDTSEAIERDRWRAVVVHFTGESSGSLRALRRRRRRAGHVGIGYHFAVGNGRGAPDGEIAVGQRWRLQLPGEHSGGENARWYNEHAVGVCLIGRADRPPTQAQLDAAVWLVKRLQERFDIPADRVRLDPRVRAEGPSAFPVAEFKQRLLRRRPARTALVR